MRVLIAGGGLGGLTLAHGLRQAGLEPLVFECGRAPDQVEVSASYRIHIDASGSRALRTCLPDRLWEEFESHSAAAPDGIAFTTEALQQLAFIPDVDPQPQSSHPISRAALRKLLLSGLEDVITFDAHVVGFDQPSDARVSLRLEDGRSFEGDVLVGADGATSAIRKQLLPRARVVDSGVGGIAGKVYLNAESRAFIPPRLLRQMTMVLPMRGMAMFLAPFRQREPESQLDMPEHLFWVLIGTATDFRVPLGRSKLARADALQDARRIVAPWHPLLRQLVDAADEESLTAVPLHTSQPVDAWPSSRVTLLGDAIHTMTPLQGLGGNMALADAALLCQKLVDAGRGRTPVLSAVAEYEEGMRRTGFDAVRRSLQISNSVASHNVAARLVFRAVLRVADRIPRIRKALFQRPVADAVGNTGFPAEA